MENKYELALIQGDLSKLTEVERLNYYKNVCQTLGLNQATKPFQYIVLNNKLTLYATKDCTEQLRKLHSVSITNVDAQHVGDLYIVRATAKDGAGRTDCSTGAVSIARLSGDNLANAVMKAETKAKRRVTLSICGLGMLEESEIDTIPNAQIVDADTVHVSGDIGLPVGVTIAEEIPQSNNYQEQATGEWHVFEVGKTQKDAFKAAVKAAGGNYKWDTQNYVWLANVQEVEGFYRQL